MADTSKIKAVIQKYRDQPETFFEEILGFNAWTKQAAIARSVSKNKKTAVRSCHDSGKTAISARIALWFLFTNTPAVVITTAPTYRQVSELLWREMRHAYRTSKIPLGGHIYETPELNVADNWYALGLSTDDPDRFQGFHSENLLLIVDEAPGVDQTIFDAAEGILTSSGAKVLLIGNPTELSGEFYEAFHRHRGSYSKLNISAFDTPNFTECDISLDDIRSGAWKKKKPGRWPHPYLVTPDWVAEKFRDWGEQSPLWQVKVIGQFPSSVLNTLLTVSDLDKNFEYAIIHQMSEEEKEERHRFGVDVARFGDDRTVITHGHGKYYIGQENHSKEDTMETVGRVITAIRPYKNPIVNVDTDGVGGGVYDRLLELKANDGLDIDLYAFRGAASPTLKNVKKYANARAEAWATFGARVKSYNIILKDEDLLSRDLTAVRYKMHSKGTILVEKKDEIKKRLGHSPDNGDSAVLCFYQGEKSGWVEFYEELSAPYREQEEEKSEEYAEAIPA